MPAKQISNFRSSQIVNIAKIFNASRNYSLTGNIPNLLVPFFQQDGCWIGDKRIWRRSDYLRIRSYMKRALLPAGRRTTVNHLGENILLTSFVWKSQGPVEIFWHQIKGSIRVKSNASITAKNLRVVGRHFYATTTSDLDLPNLQQVEGDFEVMKTWKLHAPRLLSVGGSVLVADFNLTRLESVGKRLWSRGTRNVDAPNLRTVGGSLDAHGSKTFVAPVLESVGRNLMVSDGMAAYRATKLRTLGASLEAQDATVFIAPKLRTVRGNLNTASAADFYHPDLRVGQNWKMHPNAEVRLKMRLAAKRLLKALPSLEI